MRILSLPENEEKGDRTSYVVKLISEELHMAISPEDLERCHRIGMKQNDAKYPSMVTFKLWNYQTKINILRSQGGRRSKSTVGPFDSARLLS